VPLTDADQELLALQRAMSAQGAATAGLPSGEAVAADPNIIRTWELRRAAQKEAYGQWVADGDIWIGNTLVFTSGQQVPLEHVIRFNLVEREQVNRVATPELARLGKTFETDDEFLEHNPRHASRKVAPVGELHPSALDPRGGGAEIDDARQAAAKAASKPDSSADKPADPADKTESKGARSGRTSTPKED
jgi:hypothetical protein